MICSLCTRKESEKNKIKQYGKEMLCSYCLPTTANFNGVTPWLEGKPMKGNRVIVPTPQFLLD